MGGDPYFPTMGGTYWAEIEAFVTAAVNDSAGSIVYGERDLYFAASRLVLWTLQTAGLPLERPIVFGRDVIARFTALGCPELSPASRGNIRSQLLRMSEVLLDSSRVARRLQPLSAAEPTSPYTSEELTSLRTWAAAQSTPARQTNAQVLLALGVGAGLSANEIGELRVREIDVDEAGVQIHVPGARSRVVPVLDDWALSLDERRNELDPDRFAFRENHSTFYPNLVSNFVNRSRIIGVRPQTQRMRTTWIVRHLDAGTPVVALMRAAGVESLEAFTRYVRFVREIDPTITRARLSRGRL